MGNYSISPSPRNTGDRESIFELKAPGVFQLKSETISYQEWAEYVTLLRISQGALYRRFRELLCPNRLQP